MNFLSITKIRELVQVFLTKTGNHIADLAFEHRQHHAQLDFDIYMVRVQRQGAASAAAVKLDPAAVPHTGDLVFTLQFICQPV